MAGAKACATSNVFETNTDYKQIVYRILMKET